MNLSILKRPIVKWSFLYSLFNWTYYLVNLFLDIDQFSTLQLFCSIAFPYIFMYFFMKDYRKQEMGEFTFWNVFNKCLILSVFTFFISNFWMGLLNSSMFSSLYENFIMSFLIPSTFFGLTPSIFASFLIASQFKNSELNLPSGNMGKDGLLSNYQMAGFGLRLSAIIVDVFILLVIVTFIIFGSVKIFKNYDLDVPDYQIETMPSFVAVGGMLLYLFGLPLIGLLYRTIFECSKIQGTPGKMLVKIKVVNGEGNRISFIRSLGRNLSKIISSLILFVGYFFPIWTKHKQALHDLMSDTYVVRHLE